MSSKHHAPQSGRVTHAEKKMLLKKVGWAQRPPASADHLLATAGL